VFASIAPIVVVQRHIETIIPEEARGAARRFTAANVVTIVLGGLLFVLAVIGTFIPDTPG
jgi:hypothetical protein